MQLLEVTLDIEGKWVILEHYERRSKKRYKLGEKYENIKLLFTFMANHRCPIQSGVKIIVFRTGRRRLTLKVEQFQSSQ